MKTEVLALAVMWLADGICSPSELPSLNTELVLFYATQGTISYHHQFLENYKLLACGCESFQSHGQMNYFAHKELGLVVSTVIRALGEVEGEFGIQGQPGLHDVLSQQTAFILASLGLLFILLWPVSGAPLPTLSPCPGPLALSLCPS